MTIWNTVFFPPPGERHSPDDYIRNLPNLSERAQIAHRLKYLSESRIGDWPHTWIHKITDEIFQLTAGSHRLMYYLDNRTIVVLHACRKVAQKTRPRDIARAKAHYGRYIERKKG